MKAQGFLLVPCLDPGRGSGHLQRSLALARAMRALGARAQLRIEPGAMGLLTDFRRRFSLEEEDVAGPDWEKEDWDYLVLDRFRCPAAEYLRYRAIAPLIGIDEGGAMRPGFDYLIDVLPRLSDKPKANIANALCFLDMPRGQREGPKAIKNLLISMGGEDKGGLGPWAACRLFKPLSQRGIEITLVRPSIGGSDREYAQLPPAVRVRDAGPWFREGLGDYDAVLTHFGLSAYEAAYSGALALVLDRSPYHRDLAKAAGFIRYPATAMGLRGLAAELCSPAAARAASEAIRGRIEASAKDLGHGQGTGALASFLLGLRRQARPAFRACVACHDRRGGLGAIIYRDPGRSFRLCPSCKTASLLPFTLPKLEYGHSYFFEDYKAQYGKTYLEDLPHLGLLAKGRLDRLESHGARLQGARVLDIGCAYGAFLLEARARGALVRGIEPEAEAVNHCRGQGLQVSLGFCPKELEGLAPASLDIVSLWYVIEHFEDLEPVLAQIGRILKPGGFLAMATPSRAGVSARFLPGGFYASSPVDHYAVLDPRGLARALSRHGFAPPRIHSIGHHPERLNPPGFLKVGLGYALLMGLSKALGLGDSFEAYARKAR